MSAQDELHPSPAPALQRAQGEGEALRQAQGERAPDGARGEPSPAPPAPDEPRAWAEVLAAWGEEAAHRAYLARFSDLEGLAQAGRRYRAVLAERPGDPLADRMRAEIVKRATVVGLSSLPRTAPPRVDARRVPRWVLWSVGTVLAALAWAAFRALAGALGANP